MNNGAINSFSINGASVPNWIVRAIGIVAVAAATVTIAPTRIANASAYGDAVASVTFAPTQTVLARATATAGATNYLAPHLVFAGKSTATAGATGNGSVKRDIFAQAGGDAYATGLALTAQAIGSASNTAATTVVLCKPHIVFFGKSNVIGLASTVSDTAKVTRYCAATSTARIQYTRGEASIKYAGHGYYNLDGYVPLATAGCTVSIPKDRVVAIVTFGAFDFAYCGGSANTFIRYTTRSNSYGVSTPILAQARRVLRGTAYGAAEATSLIEPEKGRFGQAVGTAFSYHGLITPKFVRAAFALSNASTTANAVEGKRTTKAESYATADATSNYPAFGNQQKSVVLAIADATGILVQSKYRAAGTCYSVAQCTSNYPVVGTQNRATSTAQGTATANNPIAILNLIGKAQANAIAIVEKAYAVANSEIPAQADRYMIVGVDPREMIVPFEDRTMTVSA